MTHLKFSAHCPRCGKFVRLNRPFLGTIHRHPHKFRLCFHPRGAELRILYAFSGVGRGSLSAQEILQKAEFGQSSRVILDTLVETGVLLRTRVGCAQGRVVYALTRSSREALDRLWLDLFVARK